MSHGFTLARACAALGLIAASACTTPRTYASVCIDFAPGVSDADFQDGLHVRGGFNWDGLSLDADIPHETSLPIGRGAMPLTIPGWFTVGSTQTQLATVALDDTPCEDPDPTTCAAPKLRRLFQLPFEGNANFAVHIVLHPACRDPAPASMACPPGMATCSLSLACEAMHPAQTCGNWERSDCEAIRVRGGAVSRYELRFADSGPSPQPSPR